MKIFFDLDGTLIDSSLRHKVLFQRAVEEICGTIEDCVVKEYFEYKRRGYSTYKYTKEKMGLSDIEIQKICTLWQKGIEKEEALRTDSLYEESLYVLKMLKDKKVDIVYVSARNNEKGTMKELSRLGIDVYAQEIFIVGTKDALSNKIRAIQKTKMQDDIVVGDTEIDYSLAQNLGLRSIILNRGFRNKEYWDRMKVKTYDNILEPLLIYLN